MEAFIESSSSHAANTTVVRSEHTCGECGGDGVRRVSAERHETRLQNALSIEAQQLLADGRQQRAHQFDAHTQHY